MKIEQRLLNRFILIAVPAMISSEMIRTCIKVIVLKAACRSAAIALSILSAPPTWAGEAECKAVVGALMLMVKQPVVRQTETRPDFPGAITIVFAQSAMFVSAGGPWKKMDVTAARRITQMESLLKMLPLAECLLAETDVIDGVVALKFDYVQGSNKASIWVGVTDGLPYRLQAGTVVSKMEYTGFVMPVP